MSELREAMNRFEDFVNLPTEYEDHCRVRDYRHALWAKWTELARTISEQEKRIAELEDDLLSANTVCLQFAIDLKRANKALTSERQRREKAERVLREIASAPSRIAENTRIIAAYFRKYEPGK